MSDHILVVDDEAVLRRTLAYNLEQHNYRVSSAANAEDALALAQRDPPDLILLDISLPGMDGLEAIQHFKRCADAPIIFVSARSREMDQVLGLELGADDYVTKPYDLSVLLARVKAVLRRADSRNRIDSTARQLTIGGLVIDAMSNQVILQGKQINLSPREFDLLYSLALQAGTFVSVSDLLAQVWGAEFQGESQVVYVHIRWLRDKIETDPNHPLWIITARGKGYKLVPHA